MANIRRAFELISEATEALRPEPLHLTISVTPTFASKWLIPRLPDFTFHFYFGVLLDLDIDGLDRLEEFVDGLHGGRRGRQP